MQSHYVSSLRYASEGVPAAALILCSQMKEFIRSCAAIYSSSRYEREDLYSDIVLSLLEYPELVKHPKQFIRIIAKNLAMNKSRIGSGHWEVAESSISKLIDGMKDSLIERKLSADSGRVSAVDTIVLQDTLLRMEARLTPSEKKVYRLLEEGHAQAELSNLLGVSKQCVSKMMRSIREKFLAAESCG